MPEAFPAAAAITVRVRLCAALEMSAVGAYLIVLFGTGRANMLYTVAPVSVQGSAYVTCGSALMHEIYSLKTGRYNEAGFDDVRIQMYFGDIIFQIAHVLS